MIATPKQIEQVKGYYQTHIDSGEQPESVVAACTNAIARINMAPSITVEQLRTLVSQELNTARQCSGSITLRDTEERHRPSEKAKKFRIGIVGVSSDIWIEQPNIPDCPYGDTRVWDIENGASYQEQLFCKLRNCSINPSGFTCKGCNAADWLVSEVENGMMTEREALRIAREYNLES